MNRVLLLVVCIAAPVFSHQLLIGTVSTCKEDVESVRVENENRNVSTIETSVAEHIIREKIAPNILDTLFKELPYDSAIWASFPQNVHLWGYESLPRNPLWSKEGLFVLTDKSIPVILLTPDKRPQGIFSCTMAFSLYEATRTIRNRIFELFRKEVALTFSYNLCEFPQPHHISKDLEFLVIEENGKKHKFKDIRKLERYRGTAAQVEANYGGCHSVYEVHAVENQNTVKPVLQQHRDNELEFLLESC